MIPYSEEAYQLQIFPGLHDAKNWSKDRILAEIKKKQGANNRENIF